MMKHDLPEGVSGVLNRFAKANAEAIDSSMPPGFVEVARAAAELVSAPTTTVLCGNRMRGKTWIAHSTCRAFHRAEKTYRYDLTPTFCGLLGVLRRDWQQRIGIYRKYDVLVFDEVHERRCNPEIQSRWPDLIDARDGDGKATLLVCGILPSELAGCLGERIFSRVGKVLYADWPQITPAVTLPEDSRETGSAGGRSPRRL